MKAYPEYKDSGVEWIGEIPNHWEVSALKFQDKIIMGQSPSSESYCDKNSGIPFLQGNADFQERFPKETVWSRESNKTSEVNDILISVRAPIGAVNISNKKYGIGRGLSAIRASKSNSTYLFYLLTIANSELNSWGTGSTYKAISSEVLSNVIFAFPPFHEQTAIANFLDHKTAQIDESTTKRKQLIELLQEQRKAIINEAVTKGINPNVKMKDSGIEWIGEIPEHWEVKPVRFLFDFGRGLSITKKDLIKEGIPCLNYGEIHSKYGFRVDPDVHVLKCVEEDMMMNNENSLLKQGDFIFADTSEDIEGSGNFSFIDSTKPVFAGYHTVVLKQKTKNNYKFLAYLFDSIDFRTQIRRSVKGVKVFSITQGILKNTKAILPPIKEQKEIATYLENATEQIDNDIQSAQKEITLLEEYRQSLITEAVTGKIDVRDYKLN